MAVFWQIYLTTDKKENSYEKHHYEGLYLTYLCAKKRRYESQNFVTLTFEF